MALDATAAGRVGRLFGDAVDTTARPVVASVDAASSAPLGVEDVLGRLRSLGLGARSTVDAIEMLREAARGTGAGLGGPTIRELMTELVAEVAWRRPYDISVDDVARVAAIQQLPSSARPMVFEHVLTNFDDLVYSRAPFTAARSREAIRELGDWFTVNSEPTRSELVAAARGGEPVDASLLRALADGPTIADLADHELLRAALGNVRRSTDTGAAPSLADLRVARHVAARIRADGPEQADARATVLAVLQRNIDRIDGTVVDGHRYDPDFADLGRGIAAADLLAQLREAAPAHPTPVAW